MIPLIVILAGIFLALWLIPGKKNSVAKGVVDTISAPFSHAPAPAMSLFQQQLSEEAEILASAYREKANAAKVAEVVEKANSLLSK